MADSNDSGRDDDDASAPLLLQHVRDHTGAADDGGDVSACCARYRAYCREKLDSKRKHYFILALVALDVVCILTDVFITLISCDTGRKNEEWVSRTHEALEIPGLVFSCIFLLELLLCVWAFGFGYFKSWFHCFDALIIVMSFVVDLLTHGTVEEIASLVVILRLWRFVKIVEELSVGASERMEDMEVQLRRLKDENAGLKDQLETYETQYGDNNPGPAL